MSVAWAPDLWYMQKALLELLVEPAEGGVAPAEEQDKEEDRKRRSSAAGRVAPLQAPEPV